MPKAKQRRASPAFTFRAGVGIAGTPITCDALGFPDDLIFLAHAFSLTQAEARFLASPRAGRRQVVTTEKTLRLLGPSGDKLRSRSLPAAFGRPFNLGAHRIEVVPSGFAPGSAALLCEAEKRRVFYAGALCMNPPAQEIEPGEIRHADAICIDASAAHPDLVLPPRAEAIAAVRAFAEQAVAEKQNPVFLASPLGNLVAVAVALAGMGIPLRAHSGLATAWKLLRALCPTLPEVKRFSSPLAAGEALLWLPEAREAPALRKQTHLRFCLVSGLASSPEVRAHMRVQLGVALSTLPSYADVLAMIEASGAREIALIRGAAEPVAASLRERGLFAYALGPPRQMDLLER
jgi:hypothetical protein